MSLWHMAVLLCNALKAKATRRKPLYTKLIVLLRIVIFGDRFHIVPIRCLKNILLILLLIIHAAFFNKSLLISPKAKIVCTCIQIIVSSAADLD